MPGNRPCETAAARRRTGVSRFHNAPPSLAKPRRKPPGATMRVTQDSNPRSHDAGRSIPMENGGAGRQPGVLRIRDAPLSPRNIARKHRAQPPAITGRQPYPTQTCRRPSGATTGNSTGRQPCPGILGGQFRWGTVRRTRGSANPRCASIPANPRRKPPSARLGMGRGGAATHDPAMPGDQFRGGTARRSDEFLPA
jgi:hypothetical protein